MAEFCKRCHVDIKWITTEKGKNMPCDLPAVEYQIAPAGYNRDTIILDDGRVIRAKIIRHNPYSPLTPIVDGKGYTSHYATCPYANDFRRQR